MTCSLKSFLKAAAAVPVSAAAAVSPSAAGAARVVSSNLAVRAVAVVAVVLAIAAPSSAHAQAASTLGAGDLVFVQMASDAPDSFSWVFTKDVKAGTTIIFTDNAWDQTNFWRLAGTELRMSENSIVWTAPSDIGAGVITQYGGSNLSFATTGDNIFAFQGSWLSPQFISGTTWSSATTWITTGAATTNNSYLPSSLTQGSSAFGSGINFDNVAYTGATTSGTTADLRTAIYATPPTNWTGNETTLPTPTAGPYTFTDATPAANAVSTTGFYDFGFNAAAYSSAAVKVTGTDAAQLTFGTFANVQVVSGGTLALDVDGKDGFNNQGYATETTSTAFGTNPVLSLANDAAFEFSITVGPGYEFDLENVSFFGARNTSGPQSLALYFSLDNGSSWNQIGSNLSLGSLAWGSFNFTDTLDSLNGWTGNVAMRIYAWNAGAAAAQQLRLDEVYVQGIVAVPEPSTLGLAAAGLALAGLTAWKRRRAGQHVPTA
jgi:hypothetical protein